MSSSHLLVIVILLQEGLGCAFWLIAAGLRLARLPSRHWAGASGLVCAAMGLVLLQGWASPWLGVVAAYLCLIAALVAVRRGIQVFARIATTDGEQAGVLGLCAVAMAACRVAGLGLMPIMVMASLGLSWTLWRAATEARRSLATEFGRGAVLGCALPMYIAGALFLLRAVGPLLSDEAAVSISEPTPHNTSLLLALVVFGLVLNATLLALVTTRLVRRLQYQSRYDWLTGLLGRRPMDALLQAEAMRQRRSGQPYALLSIDIDHFKDINDRWGHAAGDAVLAAVAQALQGGAREIDSVARMGGEEFCALLPGADLAGAQHAAQRMTDAVRRLKFPAAGDALQVTVSIGVAAVHGEHEPAPSVMRRADRAMYAAKGAGRNRIEIAPPPAPKAVAA